MAVYLTHLDAFLEQTWDGILSREAERVVSVYLGLDTQNQKVVLNHLHKMAEEEGWHPEQVTSARFAIEALDRKGIR